MLRNNTFLIITLVTAVTFFGLQDSSLAQDYSWLIDAGWKVIESEHCTIFLHPEVNMEKVNNKIAIRFYSLDKTTFAPGEKSIEEQLADKLERIFMKIEQVLDMYPQDLHLNIKIFKTQAQLDDEYAKIFGSSDGMLRISYYIHKHAAIFTTEQAVREGVIAHEMGHAISDHYFLVNPSEKIKELLAQYAEIHLEE
jgi:hypothetical protein